MTDMELLKKLMQDNEWNQSQLAERLGVTQGQVSRVTNGKQDLRPALRKLAESLLK